MINVIDIMAVPMVQTPFSNNINDMESHLV